MAVHCWSPDIGVQGGGVDRLVLSFYLGFIDLELMAILLYQPPKFWDYRDEPPHPGEDASV